jgi:hypothetical protein
MEEIFLILRAFAALALIGLLLSFGFAVFLVLLALAALTSVVMWVRGKDTSMRSTRSNAYGKYVLEEDGTTPTSETVTIIDGEAEEVTHSRHP